MVHDHHASLRSDTGRVLVPALIGLMALSGCSAIGSGSTASTDAQTITLVTHDSFSLPDEVLADFTDQTGLTVQIVSQGDAGTLVNELVLTKDAPLGDVVFGIDNTFASRALAEGVVTASDAVTVSADAAAFAVPGDEDNALVAIDDGDVCVNVDHQWFTEHELAEPTGLDDLTDPTYAGLFVTPNPVTSSPGFAFLLATIGAKGDGWSEYWTALAANDVQVAADWTDAYLTAFTAGGGNGDRPIVLSYSSSPPFTVPEGGTEPTTGALLDTCFRQTEYAGVLTGAANPAGAAQLVTFLQSDEVQAAIPDAMYMYPVSTTVDLPEAWATWAPQADAPYQVDSAEIAENRTVWLQSWTDLNVG